MVKKHFLNIIAMNWKKILIFFLGAMLITSAILKVLTPSLNISYENTWYGITPGVNQIQDIIQTLGQPNRTEIKNNSKIYEYHSTQKTNSVEYTQIGFNNNQKITFIKEKYNYDTNHLLQQYVNKYGQPDLELFTSPHTYSTKAYIFLEKGIAIFAHQKDLSVEQKWYFIPTTKEVFLKTWKGELFTQEPGPEIFSLPQP